MIPFHLMKGGRNMIDRLGRVIFESDTNDSLSEIKAIVSKIRDHVKRTAKPPTGNQNCQLCTWCTEAHMRGFDVLPRPVYSPRDPVFNIKGESIVNNPIRQSLGSGLRSGIENLIDLTEIEGGRWYCHVNWHGSQGGHEFILMRISKVLYVVDSQQGLVTDALSKRGGEYFNDINWGNSYIVRLDDKEFNEEMFMKNNDPSQTLPWNEDLDIPYMRENGMLPDEDINEAKVERINDEGDTVPEKCDKCGSHVGLYLKGEPVWLCSNKKCGKYFGTAPCNFQESTYFMNPKTMEIINSRKTPPNVKAEGESWFEIDELAVPLVRACNNKGYVTRYCCSGHIQSRSIVDGKIYDDSDSVPEPYVVIDKTHEFKNLPNGWYVDDSSHMRYECTILRYRSKHITQSNQINSKQYLNRYSEILSAMKSLCGYFDKLPNNTVVQESTTLETVDMSKMEKIYYWSPIRLEPDQDQDDIITIEHDSPRLFVTDKIGICPFYTLYDSEIFKNITKKYNADIIPVLPRNLDELSKEENIVIKLISSEAKPRYGDFTLYVYEVDKSSISNIVHDKKYKSEYLYTIPRKNGDIIVSTKPVKVSKVHYTIEPELSNTFQESTLPDGVFLRPANESDLPNIIKWKLESVNPKTRNDPKTIRFIENDTKENLKDTKMIMSYSTVIGVLESCYIDDGEWWYIGEIYLIPEYRGKGIARVILQQEIGSHDKLKLRVSKDNTHAIDLYKSLGFGISEEDEYAYTMTLVKDHVQEGVLNDLKNGVNPYSTKRVFHISREGHLDGQVFKPRVPEYLDKYDPNYPNFEDVDNPRVCFSPSIEGCLNAIVVNVERWKADRFDKLYVYVPEKPIDQYKHTTNKQIIKDKKVYDANLTREVWIEEPVRLKMYGVIKVDQISDVKKKSTVPMLNGKKGERNYYSYKWHWLIKPKVLDKVPYDYSPTAVCEDMVRDLKRYAYGIPVNGKVQNVPSSEYFDKHYRLLSPDEFKKYGGGVCWDYVEFMEGYLDAYGYSCKKYYISTDTKDGDTHTFITVDDGKGGLLYPESSFKLIEGLHKVKNVEEAIKMITSKMFEVNNNSKKYSEIKYYVWEYTGHPEYGSNCVQCTEYFSKGEPFYEGTAINPNKQKIVKESVRMSYPDRFGNNTMTRLSSRMTTDDGVVQEGMFDAGFSNLRMKIAKALEGKFKVTNVFKAMGGKDKFDIVSEDSNDGIKTSVESTGNGCKVVSRGMGKMKSHFNNISLSAAFDRIISLFERPEVLLEGAMPDTFSDVYMEAKVTPEQAKANREENLRLLQYDSIKRTIVIDGPDGSPIKVKASIGKYDVYGIDPINTMAGKKSIYAASNKNGDAYIRIPPSYLEKDPKYLQPLIAHEAEHVNQINNNKRKHGDMIGGISPRDSESVIKYTRKFIDKHSRQLNNHDKLEAELLADFHAATKFGRKAYSKALRKLTYYGLSLKEFRKARIDTYEDDSPVVKLYRSGETSVDKYIKAAELQIAKFERLKKNCEAIVSLSKDDQGKFDVIGLGGTRVETSVYDQCELTLTRVNILMDSAKAFLERLKSHESDVIDDSIKAECKQINTQIKILSSKIVSLPTLIANITSTELRIKFLKQIMKDKPWLNDSVVSEFFTINGFDDFDVDNFYLEADEDIDDSDDDSVDLNSFGSDNDGSSPNNQYDEEEVSRLNELISDENHAVGQYFEAAKTTNNEVLRRLFSDIGNEERFHTEQLLYAKSTITGEKYEPMDKDVKKEYEELLAMGMDEEDAFNTAIDKQHLNAEDDGDDSDMEELEVDTKALGESFQYYTNCIELCKIITESDLFESGSEAIRNSMIVMESVLYMEEVGPVDQQKSFLKNNPITFIIKGFFSFIKFINGLVDKIKLFVRKVQTKQHRMHEWIKRNGIKQLFADGINMYFYDDRDLEHVNSSALLYCDMLCRIVELIAKDMGLNFQSRHKINDTSKIVQFNNVDDGLRRFKVVVFSKTKIVVNENNEQKLAELFFGYSRGKLPTGKSVNIYHTLDMVANEIKKASEEVNNFITSVGALDKDLNSIYYKDPKKYRLGVDRLNKVYKGLTIIGKALASDMNEVLKLNNGLLEKTRAADANDMGINPNNNN